MKLFCQSAAFFLLLLLFACSNVEHKTTIPAPATSPAPKVVVPTPEQEVFPDIQTLSDNHKILLIRVAGDLSKLSPATKAKVETQKTAFNAGYEAFKKAIEARDGIQTKLKNLAADQAAGAKKTPEQDELAKALEAANENADQAQSQYQELMRQFAQLIETVKSERTKQ